MTWVLIIAMFSPGGDWAGKQEVVMPNRVTCKRAVRDIDGTRDMMGLRYKALCVQRDAQGMNIGNKPLD